MIATAILLFAINSLSSQPRRYPVAFYNLENLFDTIDTPNVVDEEFT
ncbi:MAG: endonuclease/exonuclease/phosphatase family protein, partial [Bacteroidia bacterium]|nr:endonuclease/exonuclease/phosphatase family protein [Bacteroidia bacterium]